MSTIGLRARIILAAAVIIASTATVPAQPQLPPGGFGRVPTLPFPATAQEFELSGTRYRVVPAATGLANPWGIAFLPNGDMLVTERPGRLRIVRNGTLDPQPIGGVPTVWATGQGGLLEVLPHPGFNREPVAVSRPIRSRASRAAHDGALPRAVRREGDRRRQGPLRRRQLQHRQPALRIEARVRNRRVALHDDRRARRSAARAESRHPRRQGAPAHAGGSAASGQSVPEDAGTQARDLHLRQPEPAGARDSPADRRRVGERTRTAGRRRVEHPAGRQELRLAHRVVRARGTVPTAP